MTAEPNPNRPHKWGQYPKGSEPMTANDYPPKPRPSVWDFRCRQCGHRTRGRATALRSPRKCGNVKCGAQMSRRAGLTFHNPSALWGELWSVVVELAIAKRLKLSSVGGK